MRVNFTSIQLYKNPVKSFLKFLYYIKVQIGTSTKSDLIDYEKKFWKVKIAYINKKDSSESLPLDLMEEKYIIFIEKEANKLIEIINKSTKNQLQTIIIAFAIHINKSIIFLQIRR